MTEGTLALASNRRGVIQKAKAKEQVGFGQEYHTRSTAQGTYRTNDAYDRDRYDPWAVHSMVLRHLHAVSHRSICPLISGPHPSTLSPLPLASPVVHVLSVSSNQLKHVQCNLAGIDRLKDVMSRPPS